MSVLDPIRPDDYLATALSSAQWLRSVKHTTDAGAHWPLEPDAEPAYDTSLQIGTAGTIIFLLELADATGDDEVLAEAVEAGRQLLHLEDADTPPEPSFWIPGADVSLHLGRAGKAHAMLELARASGDETFRDAARRWSDELLESSQHDDGVYWADQPALIADGGVALHLLRAAEVSGDGRYRDVAVEALRHIASRAEADPRGGIRWHALDPTSLGAAEGTVWPNFELGTAGVAYALARGYEATGDQALLDAALAGAEHIRSIAVVDGDAALVAYREPDMTDLHYLGACHGPVGTTRLFHLLHRITGDSQHSEWVEKLFNGVAATGAPDRHSPGYWQNSTLCCGTAGFVHWGVGLWAATGEQRYLDFARRAGDKLLGDTFTADGGPVRWYDAFTRTQPDVVSAQTGLVGGNAGNAFALLHLHKALRGENARYRLPD
ncbi:MAG: hypothetical protein GX596_04155, partial [Propionibacterium sp.]|nr:hypothetical protein [Propionibacterium sp.]